MLYQKSKKENAALRQKLFRIERQVNSGIKLLQRNLSLRRGSNQSQSKVPIPEGLERQDTSKNIHTLTHIFDDERDVEEKIKELVSCFKLWEKSLTQREEEWIKHFEQQLCEHSFEGISKLISSSFLARDQKPSNDFDFEGSDFKKNEEELIK